MPLKNGRIKTVIQDITVDMATPPSIQLSSLSVDWSLGYVFSKEILLSSALTFSNITDGKVITIIIKNSSVSNISITLPSGLYKTSDLDLNIEAGKENIYTFISSNNKVYVSCVPKFTNI